MRKLVLAAAVALGGCGGSPEVLVPASAPRAPRATAASPSADEHKISRSAVREVVSMGLGVFLQHLTLDDQPVRTGGVFHGFRVAALSNESFWSGIDLRPGDVVTSVNGLPIERPEQAQTAFESLEVSSELRVAYERDGKPRELAFAIVDDR